MSSNTVTASVPTKRGSRGLLFQLNAWVPVLLAIALIATESTAYFGADHTSGPLQSFIEFFTGPLRQPQWWRLHIILRKCGHFTGYGIVSLTWFRAFWMTWRTERARFTRRFSAHLLAMAGTFLVAAADEFHQTFLPNRTGTPWDVLIDCCGALAAQLLLILVTYRSLRD